MASNYWSNFVLPVNSFPLIYLSHARVFPICQFQVTIVVSPFPFRTTYLRKLFFTNMIFANNTTALPY